MNVQQNDPAELLEVLDGAGRATGVAKSRSAIHLDGDWHLAFHCWILRDAGREVVLQRRSFHKDTFAGLWDAAAAGHWRYGELPAEAAREIAEELGITVRFDDLRFRGREKTQRRFPNGLIDREFHEVYVLEDDRPLSDYLPDPSEVIGLAAFPLADLLDLASDTRESVTATEAMLIGDDGGYGRADVTALKPDFVPYSAARLRRNLGRPQRVDRI